MYSCPTLHRPEQVFSVLGLIEAIKQRQVISAKKLFNLIINDSRLSVRLLTNGWLEIEGRVQSSLIEKELEEAMKKTCVLLGDSTGGSF